SSTSTSNWPAASLMAAASLVASYGGHQGEVTKLYSSAYREALAFSVSITATEPPSASTVAQASAVWVLPEPVGPSSATRALASERLAGVKLRVLIVRPPGARGRIRRVLGRHAH